MKALIGAELSSDWAVVGNEIVSMNANRGLSAFLVFIRSTVEIRGVSGICFFGLIVRWRVLCVDVSNESRSGDRGVADKTRVISQQILNPGKIVVAHVVLRA